MFCGAYTRDEDFTGATVPLIARGLLPACVDAADPRVTAIGSRCRAKQRPSGGT